MYARIPPLSMGMPMSVRVRVYSHARLQGGCLETSFPLSLCIGLYLPTQSQASYRSASSSTSARRPSSGFDIDNTARMSSLQTGMPMSMTTMPTTMFSMTLSVKSSALHPGSQLLATLISLLAPSTSTSTSPALHVSLHSSPSSLPSPLLLFLLLLGSPSEIQEFSRSNSSFSLIVNE